MDNATILCLLAAVCLAIKWYFSGSNNYPPGPFGPIPFIRNAFQMPTMTPWFDYARWSQEYGSPIIFARALGEKLLILNSYDDAFELLERRARKTSDRPSLTLFKLMGLGNNAVLNKHNDIWRMQRRMLHQSMKKEDGLLDSFRPIIEESVKRLVKGMIGDSSAGRNSLTHLKKYTGEVIISLTYGYKLTDPSIAPLLKDLAYLDKIGSAALLPGAYLINTFPVLKYFPRWLPGGGFHAVVDKCKPLSKRLSTEPYTYAKEKMKSREDVGESEDDSFRLAPREPMVQQWLQSIEDEEGSYSGLESALKSMKDGNSLESILKDTALTIFQAGFDTTAASLAWFILAMAKYPEIQKKGQDSIMAVLGPNRLPNFEDRPSIPYLEAMYMETLRWRIVTPLAVPHRVTEDDVYNGYLIPAGTVIIPNTWAMSRDEEKYPNPEEFRPERFLNDDGSVKYEERILAFGFGRRICVGKYVASDVLWLGMATILATFHISKEKDEQGNELEISDEMTNEIVVHPTAMQCSITVRKDIDLDLGTML